MNLELTTEFDNSKDKKIIVLREKHRKLFERENYSPEKYKGEKAIKNRIFDRHNNMTNPEISSQKLKDYVEEMAIYKEDYILISVEQEMEENDNT